jgi:hypothetical protein
MKDRVDLVNVSGRENLPVSQRVALLAADLMFEPFVGITEASRASSQTIHDLKLTVGRIRGTIELHAEAVARGQNDETLAKGADSFLSETECLVLAWRRGGHREYKRVRKLQ